MSFGGDGFATDAAFGEGDVFRAGLGRDDGQTINMSRVFVDGVDGCRGAWDWWNWGEHSLSPQTRMMSGA